MLPSISHRIRAAAGAALIALSAAGSALHASPAPIGSSTHDFLLTTAAALLRPAATVRVRAPFGGSFTLAAANQPLAAGAVIGRFDDHALKTAADNAQLRLQIARQLDADFAAGQPARRQDARRLVTELEQKLALAQALAKDPALLQALPPGTRDALGQDDPAALTARLDAARRQAARLDDPAFDHTSATRLQVLDAEQALREARRLLAAAIVTAPISGSFQPAADLAGANHPLPVSAGQIIGTLRDISRVEAVIPVLSPYLLRIPPQLSRLQVEGPGGILCTATFKTSATETAPATGETRVFIYEFSPADSAALAGIVNTNLNAQILLHCDPPVIVVPKLRAALNHAGAFHDGWEAGVARIWPGWNLVCEGEQSLGLAPAKP
jgi:hypothetical protein